MQNFTERNLNTKIISVLHKNAHDKRVSRKFS